MPQLRPALRRMMAAAAAVTLAVLGVVVGPTSPAAGRAITGSADQVPGQFIAKLYTEGLGRLPLQTEWTAAVGVFSAGGCTPQTLAEVGQQVYTSAGYAGLGYDNVSRLITLYRGAWNTEPDPTGLAEWRRQLDHGEPWSSVVARFFIAGEFLDLVPRICSGASDSSATSYALAGRQPAAMPTASAGFTGNQQDLQAVLDDTPPGGIVQLAQRALVPLTRPLTVPAGVLLTTTGGPDTAHYAEMGRLVRAAHFGAPLVDVADGATLTNVWVDGGRNSPGNLRPAEHDVRLLGGRNTAVRANKISNTAGTTSIEVLGQGAGHPCSGVVVGQNLITAYSNDHYLTGRLPDGSSAGAWTDGISVDCADTTVTRNQIVDTGGVGIAVHGGTEVPQARVPQRSRIIDNTVLSAGISMYAGIVADPLFFVPGRGQPRSYPYDGATISGNVLWTAPNTHFVIGISAGSRAWYAGRAMIGPNSGSGLTIAGNRTGPVGARVRTGIAISGMDRVQLSTAPAGWLHDGVSGKPGNPCPDADLAISRSAGTANGVHTDATPYSDTAFDGCMGEP